MPEARPNSLFAFTYRRIRALFAVEYFFEVSARKKSHTETTYVTCCITHHRNSPTKLLPKIWTEHVEYRVGYIQTTDVSAKIIFQFLLFIVKKYRCPSIAKTD